MAAENVNTRRPNIRIEIQNTMSDLMDVDEEDSAKLSDNEEGEIVDDATDFHDFANITYPSRPTSESLHKKVSLNDDLKTLQESLGICTENEKLVRFDALHMHGTDSMSSLDVLDYFDKYSPIGIEWIDNDCCNITWLDVITPARALLQLSTAVNGMSGPHDQSVKEGTKRRSILFQTMQVEQELESISGISTPIPAGYWRLGVSHAKSRRILLRFALKTDKKSLKTEKFKFGGEKKEQFKVILERNNALNKNPWGDLARSWSKDKKTEEIVFPALEESVSLDAHLKQRLGFKRSQQMINNDEQSSQKPKFPRMRMYADEEEEKVKRKKTLQALRRVAKQENDLRSMIGRKESLTLSKEVENEVEDEETLNPPQSIDVDVSLDLGSKLMNRRLKFSTNMKVSNQQLSKQHRFKAELLRNKRYKSPPPPLRPRGKFSSSEIESDDSYYSDEDMDGKTNSKVTVVIKKQKQPAVASTVWSRVNCAEESLRNKKIVIVNDGISGKERRRMQSESDSSMSEVGESNEDQIKPAFIDRPGFKSALGDFKASDYKSPLRIEINNDHFVD